MLEITLSKRSTFSYTERFTCEKKLLLSITILLNLPLRTEEFTIGNFIINILTTAGTKRFQYY